MDYQSQDMPRMGLSYLDAARQNNPQELGGMIKARVAELNRGGGGDPWREGMQNLFQQLVMMGYSPAHASRLIEESAGVKGLGMGMNSGVVPHAGAENPFGPRVPGGSPAQAAQPGMMEALGSWLANYGGDTDARVRSLVESGIGAGYRPLGLGNVGMGALMGATMGGAEDAVRGGLGGFQMALGMPSMLLDEGTSQRRGGGAGASY